MNQYSEQDNTVPLTVDSRRVSKAISYASRLLGNREYSQKTLLSKIANKGYSKREAQQAIDYLIENNWLSDVRFCESFIRSKISKGQGLTRIVYELKMHGVHSALVERILDELNISWQVVCDQTISKKLKVSGTQNDLQGRQKIERFLRYRGFSGAEISHSIDKYMHNLGVTAGEYDE